MFSPIDFVSFYIELPIMLIMYLAWLFLKRQPYKKAQAIALPPDIDDGGARPPNAGVRWLDLVDTAEVDLHRDEYADEAADLVDDQKREKRLRGRAWWAWRVYYLAA